MPCVKKYRSLCWYSRLSTFDEQQNIRHDGNCAIILSAKIPLNSEPKFKQKYCAAIAKISPENHMAPQYPPFMFAYGTIAQVFAKIQEFDTPPVFSHDFLRFKLGFGRESDRAFIALAKRIGLLTTEGTPTDMYLRLRDPAKVAAVVAEGMKIGFPTFYAKYPDAHDLDRKTLATLVADVTGLELGHANARAIVGTFFTLKTLANPPEGVAPTVNRRKIMERRKGG